jgi:hypothetical protein
MSKDDRFVAPTVYQCFAPRVFLHREEAISEQFGKLQMRRPMDSVKVRMESPQEDEFGLVNLCGLSPYMGAIFARAERIKNTYFQYLSFKEASAEEVARWKDAVVFFYKKVLFKKQDKRLILKVAKGLGRALGRVEGNVYGSYEDNRTVFPPRRNHARDSSHRAKCRHRLLFPIPPSPPPPPPPGSMSKNRFPPPKL